MLTIRFTMLFFLVGGGAMLAALIAYALYASRSRMSDAKKKHRTPDGADGEWANVRLTDDGELTDIPFYTEEEIQRFHDLAEKRFVSRVNSEYENVPPIDLDKLDTVYYLWRNNLMTTEKAFRTLDMPRFDEATENLDALDR